MKSNSITFSVGLRIVVAALIIIVVIAPTTALANPRRLCCGNGGGAPRDRMGLHHCRSQSTRSLLFSPRKCQKESISSEAFLPQEHANIYPRASRKSCGDSIDGIFFGGSHASDNDWLNQLSDISVPETEVCTVSSAEVERIARITHRFRALGIIYQLRIMHLDTEIFVSYRDLEKARAVCLAIQ
jgi:hypothetical protein